ncbi:hypothetical protein [Brevundimonas sp. SL130]|uniref:hypothetical protein n=1 Tax=Brevundimonas sp. SL130 TaxID=2995143 RepID=UPI00226C8F6B|nr:hypothetical protein [Brevundimonas sp. SL130]WAC60623.1 hypothetical protein OU998_04020 [Brevundimonas sp. SL130]
MFDAFFKARPRLRAALFGLAVCTPSFVVGVTAAFAQPQRFAELVDQFLAD